MIPADLISKVQKAHDRCVDTQSRWAMAAAKHGKTEKAYAAYEKAEAAFDKALARLVDAARR